MATSVSKNTETKARIHGITWTLFNYEPYVEAVKEYARRECQYMIFGFETCPDTGKKHLQGYHYYTNARAYPNKKWRAVTDLEKNGRDFISRGSAQQNHDYCSKLGDFWEFGEIPEQGARTDWRQAVEQINTGAHIHDVVQTQPQLLPAIRALERFKQLALKPKHRDVEVIVLTGDAGTGKSKWAWDNYPDLYSKPDGQWYDGYTGQTTLLLDDYYGDIPYAQFLKVLDRYPLQVPIKGGFVYAQWERVIITSNMKLDQLYPMTDALKRRITETREFT